MAYVLKDSHTSGTGDSLTLAFGSVIVDKGAQTFTAGSSYTIARVGIRIQCDNLPASATVSLYSTSAGLPDSELASCTIDATTTVAGGEMVYGVLNTPVALTQGTVYAIVVAADNDTIIWSGSQANAYAGGVALYNSIFAAFGLGWNNTLNDANRDVFFETYLDYTFSPPVPSGLNAMLTIRRLVVAAANKIYYET